ncbi:MAG: ribonuclease PH [Phycisphaeraceae bacterium]
MARSDGRAADALRPIDIDTGFVGTADGSVLFSIGGTRVICTASLVEGVPRWREGTGEGWLTAEYSMLPASTGERRPRDVARGRPDGRTVEIQRLIGRSLRAVLDARALGERTVYLDCDVLEADGGTRCASITGVYVALELALRGLIDSGDLGELPLRDAVAAVSCGLVAGEPLLDLHFGEDQKADVDMNVVMTAAGELIEVQATGEGVSFPRSSFDALMELAGSGIASLLDAQRTALAG